MILSDVDIRKELAAGRIEIDPFDDACVQPSSVDLHVDSRFRVFANSRYPYIDVRREMPDLTEVVEVAEDTDLVQIDRISTHYGGRAYPVRDRGRVNAWIEIDRWHGWGAAKA